MSRAAGARAAAAAFIEARGDDLTRERVRVLAGRLPPGRLVERLETLPRADVGQALVVLGALDDHRCLDMPLAGLVCAELEKTQGDDGAWSPGAGASEDEVLFATAMAGGHLGKTRCARAEVLAAAADYLAARWSPERVQGFAWRAVAAHAHFFATVPHEHGDEVLQWCGRELERGFRAGRFDAVRTARVLLHCDAGALPGARVASDELVTALLESQGEDGGWPLSVEDGDRAAHALDGFLALMRFA